MPEQPRSSPRCNSFCCSFDWGGCLRFLYLHLNSTRSKISVYDFEVLPEEPERETNVPISPRDQNGNGSPCSSLDFGQLCFVNMSTPSLKCSEDDSFRSLTASYNPKDNIITSESQIQRCNICTRSTIRLNDKIPGTPFAFHPQERRDSNNNNINMDNSEERGDIKPFLFSSQSNLNFDSPLLQSEVQVNVSDDAKVKHKTSDILQGLVFPVAQNETPLSRETISKPTSTEKFSETVNRNSRCSTKRTCDLTNDRISASDHPQQIRKNLLDIEMCEDLRERLLLDRDSQLISLESPLSEDVQRTKMVANEDDQEPQVSTICEYTSSKLTNIGNPIIHDNSKGTFETLDERNYKCRLKNQSPMNETQMEIMREVHSDVVLSSYAEILPVNATFSCRESTSSYNIISMDVSDKRCGTLGINIEGENSKDSVVDCTSSKTTYELNTTQRNSISKIEEVNLSWVSSENDPWNDAFTSVISRPSGLNYAVHLNWRRLSRFIRSLFTMGEVDLNRT